jgi:hypothetical protein
LGKNIENAETRNTSTISPVFLVKYDFPDLKPRKVQVLFFKVEPILVA